MLLVKIILCASVVGKNTMIRFVVMYSGCKKKSNTRYIILVWNEFFNLELFPAIRFNLSSPELVSGS